MQCVKLALVEAVTTDHTTRIVHCTVLEINGLCLAVLFSHAAVFALVLIETNAKQRETRDEAEESANRTNGVAVDATFAPGEKA